MKSKYIILDYGYPAPVVFTEMLKHSDVARALSGNVLGAGFCQITDDGEYICYGVSESLNIKSRGQTDSDVLNEMLGATN